MKTRIPSNSTMGCMMGTMRIMCCVMPKMEHGRPFSAVVTRE